MKRLDEGKVSLVDFLRSIKTRKRSGTRRPVERDPVGSERRFATLNPHAREPSSDGADDSSTVRSAN